MWQTLNKTQKGSALVWAVLVVVGLYLMSQAIDSPHWMWAYSVGAAELAGMVFSNFLPLSPLVQWIDDRGSDNAAWYQGFRFLAVALAWWLAGMVFWIVSSGPGLAVALPLGVGLGLWLTYHWTRPEYYDRKT